jgi:outer membrane protein OmpA-like peptidoglycan-associated protein
MPNKRKRNVAEHPEGLHENGSSDDPASSKDELSQVRNLLLGFEQAQLARLQQRLDDPERRATELSEVLPEAIMLRSSRDDKLTTAIMPDIEKALDVSVKRNSRVLVDTLFPLIGPVIRKSIGETIREMILSFNQGLEHTFSFRGLKWRLEAMRTGKAFGEVVFLHTLVYRVEQVFLIHKETGLVLQHVVRPGVINQDADMVASMLTAIQDFARDSFRLETDEVLEGLQVGDLNVWIESGPHAVLATVIRGSAPHDMRYGLQSALETIHLRQKDQLESFEGEVDLFEASRVHLEACLVQAEREEEKRPPIFALIIIGIVIAALGVLAILGARNKARWADYFENLKIEQGIVVTGVEKQGGRYRVSGLRDPLAADPYEMLRVANLDAGKLIGEWEPYQAMYPEFILERTRMAIAPPTTVELAIDNGVLSISGSASHRWIVDARKVARAIPGVYEVNDDSLTDRDVVRIQATKERIERLMPHFIYNTRILVEGQDDILQALAAEIQELHRVADVIGTDFHIKIVGHTDSSGGERANLRLSERRAEEAASLLESSGLDKRFFSTVGVGRTQPLREEISEEDRAVNRRVSLEISLGKDLVNDTD